MRKLKVLSWTLALCFLLSIVPAAVTEEQAGLVVEMIEPEIPLADSTGGDTGLIVDYSGDISEADESYTEVSAPEEVWTEPVEEIGEFQIEAPAAEMGYARIVAEYAVVYAGNDGPENTAVIPAGAVVLMTGPAFDRAPIACNVGGVVVEGYIDLADVVVLDGLETAGYLDACAASAEAVLYGNDINWPLLPVQSYESDPYAISANGDSVPEGYSAPSSFTSRRYSGTWLWPLGEAHTSVSSYPGYRTSSLDESSAYHHGIDIQEAPRAKVYAARGGHAVVMKGLFPDMAEKPGETWVAIDHGDGFYTAYGPLSDISVKDETVNAGEVIGWIPYAEISLYGSYGKTFHFEITYNWRGAGQLSNYEDTWASPWGANGWEIVDSSPSSQNYVYTISDQPESETLHICYENSTYKVSTAFDYRVAPEEDGAVVGSAEKGSSFVAEEAVKNQYDELWLKTTIDGKAAYAYGGYKWNGSAWEQSGKQYIEFVSEGTEITWDDDDIDGKSLPYGQSHALSGTVNSNATLVAIQGAFYRENGPWGNPTSEVAVNGEKYNLKNSAIDKALEFGSLPAGDHYSVVLTVTYLYDRGMEMGTKTVSKAFSITGGEAGAEVPVSDAAGPTITDIKVSDLDTNGYTVTCSVSDDVGVTKVVFPTWTVDNGRDDLFPQWWNEAQGTIENGVASYRIDVDQHNIEVNCYYKTLIYAYDAAGNMSSVDVGEIFVPGEKPEVNVEAGTTHTPTVFTWNAVKGARNMCLR